MSAADISGVGFSMGHGFSMGRGFSMGHSVGTAEYAVPGFGGRAPISWLGRAPIRTEVDRRPVVAILDTGVADHPWFGFGDPDPVVERWFYDASNGQFRPDDVAGSEIDPNVIDPLEGLIDPFFGHGTFIAGLIHQTCPDAKILSVKLMGPDGVVDEAALLNGLGFLHQRQQQAKAVGPGSADQLIDVVSLSMGYYHESDLHGQLYDK